jgi:DNA-binding NtrC family response regulator
MSVATATVGKAANLRRHTGIGPTMSAGDIVSESALLRSAIGDAIDRLGNITGIIGQDIEAIVAEVRDELALVFGATAEANDPGDGDATPTLEDIELSYIRAVLAKCDGYKPKAARLLGISLKTLYTKANQIQAMANHAAAISGSSG